mmetsp:Transcript_141340/g.352438  ORF Transcript_141340/g.352438 Transcript_141340/m.352438 type:complete len:234 (-) Transcript_141340:135-836(-)
MSSLIWISRIPESQRLLQSELLSLLLQAVVVEVKAIMEVGAEVGVTAIVHHRHEIKVGVSPSVETITRQVMDPLGVLRAKVVAGTVVGEHVGVMHRTSGKLCRTSRARSGTAVMSTEVVMTLSTPVRTVTTTAIMAATKITTNNIGAGVAATMMVGMGPTPVLTAVVSGKRGKHERPWRRPQHHRHEEEMRCIHEIQRLATKTMTAVLQSSPADVVRVGVRRSVEVEIRGVAM